MQDKHYWNGESAVFCREERCDELFQDVTELENHVQVKHKDIFCSSETQGNVLVKHKEMFCSGVLKYNQALQHNDKF